MSINWPPFYLTWILMIGKRLQFLVRQLYESGDRFSHVGRSGQGLKWIASANFVLCGSRVLKHWPWLHSSGNRRVQWMLLFCFPGLQCQFSLVEVHLPWPKHSLQDGIMSVPFFLIGKISWIGGQPSPSSWSSRACFYIAFNLNCLLCVHSSLLATDG